MIRLIILLTLLPVAAIADPWTTFEDYCLVPMENLDSLVAADFSIEHDKPDFTVHRLQADRAIVRVTTYKGTRRRQACVVELFDGTQWQDALSDFQAWRTAVIASGRFVVPNHDVSDGSPVDGNALYSNETREPRLRVGVIDPDAVGGPAFFAEDTDLES